MCARAPLSEGRLAAQEAQLLLQTADSEGQVAGGQDQQEDADKTHRNKNKADQQFFFQLVMYVNNHQVEAENKNSSLKGLSLCPHNK